VFASLDIGALPAREWRQADESFDTRGLRIPAFGDDRAAQIAIGDHTNQFPQLLVGHNRHGTDISIAQHFRDRLRAVTWDATSRVAAHDFSDLHGFTS